MQTSLSQLNELNNDHIAESSRTARQLADEDWVAIESKPGGGSL